VSGIGSTDTRAGLLIGMLVLLALIWGMAFLSKHFERAAAAVAPLEEVAPERLTLYVAGSGGTFENPQRSGPALLAGRGRDLALFDAGRGVAAGLRRAAVPVRQARAVFLSSLLPENTAGLDELYVLGWLDGAKAPLVVYGPPGTQRLVDGLLAAQRPGAEAQAQGFALAPEGGRVEARELADGAEVELGALRVRAFALAGGSLPALAYRLESGEHALAFAGASWDGEALVRAAERADLLATEAVYQGSLEQAAEAGADVAQLREEAKQHVALEAVGAIATRARVRGVLLARLRPPPAFHYQYEDVVEQTFRGPVHIAEDGESITP
jgi:ribonuclease BN (tRNA processing enzyme)